MSFLRWPSPSLAHTRSAPGRLREIVLAKVSVLWSGEQGQNTMRVWGPEGITIAEQIWLVVCFGRFGG